VSAVQDHEISLHGIPRDGALELCSLVIFGVKTQC
jgi:hypothetical protein